MRDILEHLEAGAETRFEQMVEGVPDGYFRCDCGRIVPIAEGVPRNYNPYSMPMCGYCMDGKK